MKKPSIQYKPDPECLLDPGTVSMGKTELRQAFLPLVSELQNQSKVVKITDRDQPVAVLISYSHYQMLHALATKAMSAGGRTVKSLIGSVEITGDLDTGSRELSNEWREALDRSAQNL